MRGDGWRRSATQVMMGLAVFGAFVAGCAEGSADPTAARAAEVRVASAAWDDAFNAGDLARLMDLYADDAVSMPFYAPAIEGKAAIEADFAGFFAEFEGLHSTTIVLLEIAGDWAIERGRYTLAVRSKDGSVLPWREAGKHIVVRRLTDGAWKVVWEIWNLDYPAE